MCAASGQHDLAQNEIARHVLNDLVLAHSERLDHARHDDRAQLRSRRLTRAASVEGLDRKELLFQFRRPRTIDAFDLLGLAGGRFQAERNVVGQNVAADRNRRGIDRAAAGVDGDIGRAAADVEQHHAHLFFFGQERCRRTGQRLEDEPGGLEPRAVHAFQDVGDERGAAGDDVRVDLEPASGHANRILDPVLSVDGKEARQRMDDLPVARDADNLAGLDHAVDVVAADLAVLVLHGHDCAVIGAADVLAGDGDVNVGDVDAGHALGLFGGGFDRLDRLLEVGHHALTHPQRRRFPIADNLQALGSVGGDNSARLGRAYVQPRNGAMLHPRSPQAQYIVARLLKPYNV